MASAWRENVSDPRPPDVVHLVLSLQEAATLKQICMMTGGEPELSARMHTDAMNKALQMATVRSAEHPLEDDDSAGIYFLPEERSTL